MTLRGKGISERFVELRKHFGRAAGRKLSQRELAELLNIAKNSWQRYEAGELPGAKLLIRLAEEGINIHWVLTGDGEMVFRETPPALSIAAWLDKYGKGQASAEDLIPIVSAPDFDISRVKDVFINWFEARAGFTPDEWLMPLVFFPPFLVLNLPSRGEEQ